MGAIGIITGVAGGNIAMICAAVFVLIPVFFSVGAIIHGHKNK